MRLSRANLMRLGAAHAVGLGTLAFAAPAHATGDPAPPVVRTAAVGLTLELHDELAPSIAAAMNAVTTRVSQENPANMLPPASATTQADTVGQSQSQAISPTNAQESPERASTNESQHPAVSALSDEPQYHARHVQYQLRRNARSTTHRLVLPMPAFSSREPKRITRTSSPIESNNGPRNGVPNCMTDPGESWFPDVPPDSGATLPCTPEPSADEPTSDDPTDSVDCEDAGAQYQPDETQYQTPPATCEASDDSVVPIPEPEVPVSSAPPVASTSESAEAEAPASVVSPPTEPVAASTPPDGEGTQTGADTLPAPDRSQPASTKVAERHVVVRTSRPRTASSGHQARTRRAAALARSVTPSVRVRPRPLHARSTKSKASIPVPKIETARRSLEPASSRVNLFGDWVVLSLALSFAFALGMLLTAVALIAGRSLRARVGSKGLSDEHLGASRRGGIRYRE